MVNWNSWDWNLFAFGIIVGYLIFILASIDRSLKAIVRVLKYPNSP